MSPSFSSPAAESYDTVRPHSQSGASAGATKIATPAQIAALTQLVSDNRPINNRARLNSPEASRGRGGINTTQMSYPVNEEPDKRTIISFFDYQRSASSGATRELQETISLPIPLTINDEYNMEINSVDLGIYAAAGEAYTRGVDLNPSAAANKIASAFSGANFSDAKTAAQYLVALSPLSTDKAQSAARSAVGVVNNPHTTAVFNAVRLKEYAFNWKLSPRSQSDTDAIVNIITTIKQKMHPSETEGASAFALDYPDLATVTFENTKNLPEVRFSFIEGLSLTFGENGMAFYTDGMPVDLNLGIRFKEIDIITREDIT